MQSDGAVPLAYFDEGDPNAFPLMLLHGFPLHHGMWRAQWGLHPDVRIVAPDLRGFGATPSADAPLPQGHEGIERMARDVLALADRLGIDRFLLGGWSLGVDVSLMIVRMAPKRIAGIVLMNGQAEADSPEARRMHADNAEQVERHGMAVLEDALLDAFFTERTRASRPHLETLVGAWVREASVQGAVHALHALRNQPDEVPVLPQIDRPALVVVGSEDAMTPPEASQRMSGLLPHARLCVVEGSAHLTPLERPDVVNEALCSWLDDVLPDAIRALPE